jgi:hypothetical protein
LKVKSFAFANKNKENEYSNVNKGLGKDFHPINMWRCPKKGAQNSKNPPYNRMGARKNPIL